MRAERRPMLPTAVRQASHAHAAQHDARHDAAHMVGLVAALADQIEPTTRGKGIEFEARRGGFGDFKRVQENLRGTRVAVLGREALHGEGERKVDSTAGRRTGGVGWVGPDRIRRPSRLQYSTAFSGPVLRLSLVQFC